MKAVRRSTLSDLFKRAMAGLFVAWGFRARCAGVIPKELHILLKV